MRGTESPGTPVGRRTHAMGPIMFLNQWEIVYSCTAPMRGRNSPGEPGGRVEGPKISLGTNEVSPASASRQWQGWKLRGTPAQAEDENKPRVYKMFLYQWEITRICIALIRGLELPGTPGGRRIQAAGLSNVSLPMRNHTHLHRANERAGIYLVSLAGDVHMPRVPHMQHGTRSCN
jgi:hypothetical protein